MEQICVNGEVMGKIFLLQSGVLGVIGMVAYAIARRRPTVGAKKAVPSSSDATSGGEVGV